MIVNGLDLGMAAHLTHTMPRQGGQFQAIIYVSVFMKQSTKLLKKHRQATGNPKAGFVFLSRQYKQKSVPLAPNSLLKWHIKPKLDEAKIAWRGWHAFRRGLATNLYRLGVSDKTIQAILRHSNLSTTMNCYDKSVPQDAVAAMHAFEAVCRKNAPRRSNRKAQPRSPKAKYAPLMHPGSR